MNSLRDSVRQRTAHAHETLEQTPLMRAFDGTGPSSSQYGQYLSLQLKLHAPLEAALERWLPADWVGLRLRKSEWLRLDLKALGSAPETPAGAPCCIGSTAQALGVLYVLEGSTLGLHVVRKRLHATHPALHGAGRFMLGYGPDTGRHWRAFLEHFESTSKDAWPLVEDAATATFDAFVDAFSEVECTPA